MKCRRIRREILWLARFGEFGPSSQPHLDHLAGCQGCRDEIGYDREMVRQLRAALAARIEGMTPSAAAWEGILQRAQAPEPSRLSIWWSRSTSIVGRLRTATAMASTGLALVLALNMEVIPVSAPAQTDAAVEARPTTLQQVPRLPTGRTALVPFLRLDSDAAMATRPDPEADMTRAQARISTPAALPVVEEPADEEESPAQLRVVFRSLQSPEPSRADDRNAGSGAANPSTAQPEAVPSEPGQPS